MWYRRDRWQDQPAAVEVWSEKGTVGGILGPVLDEYGITFRVMRGFSSFTAVKQASVDSNEHRKKAVVLYVGDWDPSGLYMSEVDLPRRIKEYGGRWRLRRVALAKRDLRRLPGFDATSKSKDPRYQWFSD